MLCAATAGCSMQARLCFVYYFILLRFHSIFKYDIGEKVEHLMVAGFALCPSGKSAGRSSNELCMCVHIHFFIMC